MSSIRIEVDLTTQRTKAWQDDELLMECPCSGSALGRGFMEGSHRTPTGSFHISEKIGDGAPAGMVFKSREATGRVWTPEDKTDEDLILSRILWLAGDDAENSNTKSRYIYFHGTNHESELGRPSSHGCIRLSNPDVIRLFELAEVGTPVRIS